MTTQAAPRVTQPAALVAAGVVATLVVALVLVFGVVRPPAVAPLDDPSFTGSVAFLDWRDESCIVVVRSDGAQEEVHCGDLGGELVGWSDAGLHLRRWGASDRELVTVDPDTGAVEQRRDASGVGSTDPHGGRDRLETRHDDQLEVRVNGRVVWTVEADDRYEVRAAWPSPDGDRVVLQDSADRLLLVPADGSAPPVLWTEDVEPYATIVWRDAPAP